jgi:hypothetical protein
MTREKICRLHLSLSHTRVLTLLILDVWSFAVIMYEIISRQEPHVAGDPLEIAVKIRDQGATPGIPDECPEPLATIMQRCWTKEAQQRPTFQEITDYLDKVKL